MMKIEIEKAASFRDGFPLIEKMNILETQSNGETSCGIREI